LRNLIKIPLSILHRKAKRFFLTLKNTENLCAGYGEPEVGYRTGEYWA
jgi:hypothetical protein